MQDFIVSVSNLETGERWEVCVSAGEPALALNKVLRRKLFGEFLLSEQAFRFLVQDKASYTRLGDPEIEISWKPGRWWWVKAPDGSTWCETSSEEEARKAMRPGDTLWRLWRTEHEEWREA